jgi:hypothetical protein
VAPRTLREGVHPWAEPIPECGPNPYEGVYAAARPCNGKELGRSLRYTHAKAVGRVRP